MGCPVTLAQAGLVPRGVVRGGRRGGQRQHHRQAAAGGLLRGECATYRLSQPARQGQPEADPGCVVRVAEALEGREDAAEVG